MGNTQKIKMALAILLLSQMMVFGQTAIPLVYDKEYTNDNFQLPGILPIDKLPEIATLPDPFAWADGSGRSTDFKDWKRLKKNRVLIFRIWLYPVVHLPVKWHCLQGLLMSVLR